MAEITYRRTGELLRQLFKILMSSPDGMFGRDAIKQLEGSVSLSPYEAGDYPSGGRRFDRIVRFATVDCSKAGWLVKEKGRWSITEDGRKAYSDFTDGEDFYRKARKLYQAWEKNKSGYPSESSFTGEPASQPTELEDSAVEQSADVTFEAADEQARLEIEQFLHSMPPFEFQHLVADLLRAMDYHVEWVSPPGKDGGIDVLAYSDPLGTKPPRIKVQVKRVLQKVDINGLKSFAAVLDDEDIGLFVSAGGFTKDAEEYARSHAKRRITLIDLQRLVELWIRFYDKLAEVARRRFPLTPIYFLTPQD
ncbi:Mrr restriction system protein [Roseomonas sp. JC162]|uniref:Mrr restriction system protein n=1 Tax=Neoroseomonas marina TaxID=1232220 RepID=A0A848EH96_9PROT|nr:restriction endonuclease [Neoroseomonas marina]NMJ42803.1 Mrr restriction system protein [Neoroseomonas marina]